jgi:hypothetical protein
MTMPIANQIPNRSQLLHPRPAIIAPQTKTAAMGTHGTSGVRKGRGAAGSLLRMMMIPIETRANANNVPMLVMSPTTLSGMNAAKNATNTKKIQLDLAGV